MKPLDTDSRRLIDEVSAADVPAADAEARIWQTLAQRLAEPLPPTAAAASQALSTPGATGLVAGIGSKWLLAALTFAALGGGAAAWHATVRAPNTQPAVAPVSVRHSPSASAPTLPVPATPVPAQPAAASSLLEETRLIAEAQRALNAGAPGKALALIEQHSRRFAEGDLAQERDAARVLALCALGRSGDAQRARQAFARSWPDSPLAARVRAVCPPLRR
jgi:hypothetical protein